jgi:hypothetical protein
VPQAEACDEEDEPPYEKKEQIKAREGQGSIPSTADRALHAATLPSPGTRLLGKGNRRPD